MMVRLVVACWVVAGALPLGALTPETLRYNVNWPSGLTLGEGLLTSSQTTEGGWELTFQVDASLPGFTVSEQVRSAMTAGFCSVELQKKAQRGQRKADETTTFENGTARRKTANGGGETQISVSGCGRDVLAYLQFARDELAHGRVPAPSTVLYGAPYRVRMDFVGTQRVQVSEKPVTADKLNVTVKGPQADVTFEMFFARDAGRTPVLVRVPFSLGVFALELVK